MEAIHRSLSSKNSCVWISNHQSASTVLSLDQLFKLSGSVQLQKDRLADKNMFCMKTTIGHTLINKLKGNTSL